MKLTVGAAAILAAAMVTGCATNQKVAVNQLADADLTCAQITKQDSDLDAILVKAQRNKGVSGANVAAVLFFWPAAIGNYMDADKAEELVVDRKKVLADLYEAKKCSAA